MNANKKNVLIYTGPGTNIDCVRNTYNFFKSLFSQEKYDINYIHSWNIIEENWEENSEIFIIPGGADSKYATDLGKSGCEKIRKFVKNGGKYIGICAGAYFAGRKLEFEKGTNLEIIADRFLSFFNGTTVGAILKSYSYENDSGACVATVNFDNKQFAYAYYNGGCTFIPDSPKSMDNVEIIGTYAEKNNLPAIIKCNLGKGFAILSGVHFEQSDSKKIETSDSFWRKFIKEKLLTI